MLDLVARNWSMVAAICTTVVRAKMAARIVEEMVSRFPVVRTVTEMATTAARTAK